MVAEKYPLKKGKETLARYRDLDTTMFFKSVEIQMDCINS